MKKIVFVLAGLPVIFNAACKKSSTVILDPLLIPWNMDTLMPTQAAYNVGYAKLNVSGIMVACELSGTLTDTSGLTKSFTREWETAGFTGTGTAGVTAVDLNNIPMSTDYSNSFFYPDSVRLWKDTSSNHWDVSGSSTFPSISTDVAGTMPVFTGTLPDTISIASDFSFTFNSSNTANADSAFFVIYGVYVQPYLSNIVNANGGTATVSEDHLSSDGNGNAYLSVFYGSNFRPVYYGGIIMLVIYNHTIQTIGGKQFAFVKQREVLGIVHFK